MPDFGRVIQDKKQKEDKKKNMDQSSKLPFIYIVRYLSLLDSSKTLASLQVE